MLQILFADFHGRPLPKLPRDNDGSPREPDGKTLFSLEQAAEHFACPASELRDYYLASWADVMSDADAQGLGVTADSSDAPPSPIQPRVKIDTLRHLVYPHLSDEQYQHFRRVCAERGLNPWAKQVWADVRPNLRGMPEVIVELTIDGLRAVADRTGRYAGQLGPQWCGRDGIWRDVWLEDSPPAAARVAVLRHGFAEPCWGVANWEVYAQFTIDPRGREVLAESWRKMGPLMLAKCSESLALRRAFSELGGLYSREEMGHDPREAGRGPGAGHGPPGAGQANNPPRTLVDLATGEVVNETQIAGAEAEGDTPHTPMQFHLRLLDYGLKNPQWRNALIQQFREKFGWKYSEDDEGFYAAVLREIRRNPAAYRAEPPSGTA